MELSANKIFLGLMTQKLGHGHLEKTIDSILNQLLWLEVNPVPVLIEILKGLKHCLRMGYPSSFLNSKKTQNFSAIIVINDF